MRREAGFGCVICGNAFIEYEHIEPEFADAIEHDPNKMTVLCSNCNQKKRLRQISAAFVFRAKENPKANQIGHAKDYWLDIGTDYRCIIGGNDFSYCFIPAIIDGLPLLWFETEINEPPTLNFVFRNENNEIPLCISRNEIRIFSGTWDVFKLKNKYYVNQLNPIKKTILEIEIDAGNCIKVNYLISHTSAGRIFTVNQNGINFGGNCISEGDFSHASISNLIVGGIRRDCLTGAVSAINANDQSKLSTELKKIDAEGIYLINNKATFKIKDGNLFSCDGTFWGFCSQDGIYMPDDYFDLLTPHPKLYYARNQKGNYILDEFFFEII